MNQNQKQENGWNGTVYILFPALLFTVAYELTAAVLSALLSWLMTNGNSAWKAGLLNHQGDASAVCSAVAAAVGFLTIWKTARSEIAYTKPLDFSYAFPETDRPSFRFEGNAAGRGRRNGALSRGVWRRLLSSERRPADLTLAAAAGGILLSLFLNAALTAAGAVQADAGTAAASRQAAMVSLLPGILVYGVLTPFCEESVFRGITFPRACRAFLPTGASGNPDHGRTAQARGSHDRGNSVRNSGGNAGGVSACRKEAEETSTWKKIRSGTLAGILISSVLFGLYHGNLVQGFYAFCMGVVFCLFYLLSGNLVLVTALHGAVNVVTMVSSATGFYSILVSSPAWMAAVAAGAAVCGGYVWSRLRRTGGSIG